MPGRYSVEITPAAEQDVEEIWTYISADSHEAATAFIVQIDEQIETLEQFPERCPLTPENEQLGTQYRHLLFGAYRTIFRIAGTTVYILRIIHRSRLLDLSFFDAPPV